MWCLKDMQGFSSNSESEIDQWRLVAAHYLLSRLQFNGSDNYRWFHIYLPTTCSPPRRLETDHTAWAAPNSRFSSRQIFIPSALAHLSIACTLGRGKTSEDGVLFLKQCLIIPDFSISLVCSLSNYPLKPSKCTKIRIFSQAKQLKENVVRVYIELR